MTSRTGGRGPWSSWPDCAKFCVVFRLQEEDDEVSQLTIEELQATTESSYTGNLPLLGG